MKKNNNYEKCNRKKYFTKSVPTYQLENKNIDSHNNDRVEEFDQVETNNNMKSINCHCGTYDIKFQISKALLPLNLIH